jgi:hypothetical protein
MYRRYVVTLFILVAFLVMHTKSLIQIFKIVLSKAFDLKCTIPEIENVGEPLLLYQSVA